MGRQMIPAMLSSSLIMMLPGDPPDADDDNHAEDENHADDNNHAEDDGKEDNNHDDNGDDNLDDNLCSWRAAKENCSSQGGFLASIHSQVSQVIQVIVILM